VNITKAAEGYITRHPSIKDALREGLINYSALSRKICKDNEIRNFDAVLVACRRFCRKLKAGRSAERDILEILEKGKIEAKNKITVAVINKEAELDSLIELEKRIKRKGESIHIVECGGDTVIITSDEFHELVSRMFKGHITRIKKGLVEVVIKSPAEIETTPGVVSTISTLFFENDVNIVEIASCWTDTIIVIEEKDTAKVMELMRF